MFFFRSACFDQSSGQPRVNPGKQGVGGELKGKNLLIPAAAGFFSLDATSGLLATASASAPAMFLALRSALLCVCCMT